MSKKQVKSRNFSFGTIVALYKVIKKTLRNERRKTMEIKTVAILGAGAVGSYVIEGISGCSEIHLGVIAEGERNARLKSVGCTINGVTYHPEVWTSGSRQY